MLGYEDAQKYYQKIAHQDCLMKFYQKLEK